LECAPGIQIEKADKRLTNMTAITNPRLLHLRATLFILGGILVSGLLLPVGGGMCSWSTDDGKAWNAIYHVDKAK